MMHNKIWIFQYDPEIKNKVCPVEISRLPKEEKINFKHVESKPC